MLQTTRQMIFQDSGSSLNQRMKVCDIIEEPMRVQKIRPLRGSYQEEAKFQMKYVGLNPEYLKKYPGELSGGQRQRDCIAGRVDPGTDCESVPPFAEGAWLFDPVHCTRSGYGRISV